MTLDDLIKIKPYSLAKTEKSAILTRMLAELTVHHYENCREYWNIIKGMGFGPYGKITHYDCRLMRAEIKSLSRAVLENLESGGFQWPRAKKEVQTQIARIFSPF